MRTREDELDRLRVASPCRSPWEEMRGDGRRRHCLQCDRQVYDFAHLTVREAAGLIEATGGEICARLTRDGAGRLVTLEPPRTAEPVAARRSPPLAAAAVAAVLGLSGAAWTALATEAPPAAAEGVERQPAEGPRRGTGEAGGTLSGTLLREGGEPVPNAEVRVFNRLDRQERAARTDAQGSFSLTSLPAGIYRLEASWHGRPAASEDEVLLRAGEKGEVGLTVPSDVWQRIAAGEPEGMALGGAIAVTEEPIRELYAGAALVVSGVAGKSVVARRGEYTWEVRTDVVLSSVLKGETRERVISVFHDQMPDEAPAERWPAAERVLAFLDPREAESGRGSDGYATHTVFGLKTLSEADLAAYVRRLEELALISRRSSPRPAELLEWQVATAEDPATRGEAVRELGQAVGQLEARAERHGTPVDGYARKLQGVLADFAAAGGRPEGDADPAILAAFLTDAQRERLTAALLRTTHATISDLDLFELVYRWHDGRVLPWLIDRLRSGELMGWTGRRALETVAKALDDPGLADLVAAGGREIDALEEQIPDASDDATRQRLDAKTVAAEDDLRLRFLDAMARRRPGSRERP
jgi:hypothetical protein